MWVLADAGEPCGGAVVKKASSPNLTYKEADCATRFGADYEFILACRRVKRT